MCPTDMVTSTSGTSPTGGQRCCSRRAGHHRRPRNCGRCCTVTSNNSADRSSPSKFPGTRCSPWTSSGHSGFRGRRGVRERSTATVVNCCLHVACGLARTELLKIRDGRCDVVFVVRGVRSGRREQTAVDDGLCDRQRLCKPIRADQLQDIEDDGEDIGCCGLLHDVVNLRLNGSGRCFVRGRRWPDRAIGVYIVVIRTGQRIHEVIPECRGLRWVRSSGPAMPPVTTPSTSPGIGHPAKTLPLATPGARQGFPHVTAAMTSLTRLWHAPLGFRITSRHRWLAQIAPWL